VRSSNVSPVEVLKKYRVFAVVGASKNPEKDAHTVPQYLMQHGYTVVPINPTADSILGIRVYPSLAEVPQSIAASVEVVDVFRPSEELPMVARQTVEMKEKYGRPYVFWAQLGLENEEAKRLLEESGIPFVMNACTRAVHQNYIAGRS
jgi:predicted CoA-binding protein